jgi:hypothetical protein
MGTELNGNIPIESLHGENASRYITKFSALCPFCNNAQTNIQGIKHLSKLFEKGYVQVVWKHIVNNNMKLFSKKELMNTLNIMDISDGVLQDKALSILVELGYLRREIQVWIDSKGIEKERYIYIKKQTICPPECYDVERDCHRHFNWFKDGVRKFHYKPKKKEID